MWRKRCIKPREALALDFLKKEQKEHLKGELGQAKRSTVLGFIEERTERTPQGRDEPSHERLWPHVYRKKNRKISGERWAKPRDALGLKWSGMGVCKTRLLHVHPGGHGHTDLMDSCKLHNNRPESTCLSHNSVCYNQMYVCIEYLWTLNWLLAT